MKKRWIISIVISIVIVAGGVLVVWWPRTVPYEECSEIYKRYVNEEEIDASFIKGFEINDTVKMDITLLTGVTKSGWERLCSDFEVEELDDELQKKIEGGKELIFTRLVSKEDYKKIVEESSGKEELMAISYKKRSICIFHVTDEEQIHAVIRHNLNNSIKQ